MADLQSGLHNHHAAVEAFLATARSVPEERWHQARAPGKWSPGQVAEHLALAYEMARAVLEGTAPGPALPRMIRPVIRVLALRPVLRRGRFIPGSKAPKVFRPGPSPAPPAVLLERLRVAAQAFERDAGVARDDVVDHPFFGRLPLVDFVRLQEIHTQHHRGQLGSPA